LAVRRNVFEHRKKAFKCRIEMINAFSIANGILKKLDCSADASGLSGATWIDLLEPTDEQVAATARALQIAIPTRKEMRALEVSSQIYRDGNAVVMTARVVSRSESGSLRLVTVSFIRIHDVLVTLRYGDPTPFSIFTARAEKETRKLASGEAVMIGLLEAIVDRAAEILRNVGDELEALSNDIFTKDGSFAGSLNQADLRPILQKIGRNGDLATRVRESLHSLGRVVSYLQSNDVSGTADDVPARLDTVDRDITAMLDHDSYIMSNVTFLLDATLGLINIQQNAIIKIFSVAAVIFLPPTLVASIYGMNFSIIPELKWEYGYSYALGLMLLSAVLPYCYFKRRRWL
jgi:magnesium transporter